jgi:hypothetical protein
MVPIQVSDPTIGAELLRTVSSVEFVFGATTALAFERAVRDMVRSRLLGSDSDESNTGGHRPPK